MRLFFAVTLTEDNKTAIDNALHHSSVENPPWRWINPDNLHITLKFLGEMDDTSIDELLLHAAHACSQTKPFMINFSRFGGFPNLSRPRVLFYRAEVGADDLRSVADRLELALEKNMGIAKEKRAFKPHVTVARIKTSLPKTMTSKLESMAPLTDVSQEITHISLVRSELRREGAKYQTVKEIALGSGKWYYNPVL